MYQKVEETLSETVTELSNFVVGSDDLMSKAFDNVETSVEKALTKASIELKKASKKTSQGFLSVHRKASQKLQQLGVMDPPKMYRKEDMPTVMKETDIKQNCEDED